VFSYQLQAIKMKQFISVNDVDDINALVAKALAYKANPLKDSKLGENKRIGFTFSQSKFTHAFKHTDRCEEPGNGGDRFQC
jgi:hypothetical protein